LTKRRNIQKVKKEQQEEKRTSLEGGRREERQILGRVERDEGLLGRKGTGKKTRGEAGRKR